MLFSVVSKKAYERKETLFVPFAADPKVIDKLNDTDKTFLESYMKDTSFSRKDSALIKIPELGMTVLLCGVESLTESLARSVRSYADRVDSLVFDIDMFAQFSLSDDALVNAIVSAVLLGVDPGRAKHQVKLRSVTVNVPDGRIESFRDLFNRSIENITTTRSARAFGNTLSSSLSVESASESLRKGLSKRVKPRVIALKEMKTLKLSGITSLAGYSDEEPQLLVLEHKPEKGKTIVVCGTCLIDPTRFVSDRDKDGIGAAIVRAIADTYSTYDKDHHIVMLIALARFDPSRAPSNLSVRLASGTSYSVSSFEHLRFVLLADLLYYASRYKPRLVASFGADGLSGMLGHRIMTYVSNSDVLKHSFEDAGRFVHERVWELPLITTHQVQGVKRMVKLRSGGMNAPYNNIVSLELSTGGYPWMHVDVSSHTTSLRAHGSLSEGSTGIGAATMAEYLRRLFDRSEQKD